METAKEEMMLGGRGKNGSPRYYQTVLRRLEYARTLFEVVIGPQEISAFGFNPDLYDPTRWKSPKKSPIPSKDQLNSIAEKLKALLPPSQDPRVPAILFPWIPATPSTEEIIGSYLNSDWLKRRLGADVQEPCLLAMALTSTQEIDSSSNRDSVLLRKAVETLPSFTRRAAALLLGYMRQRFIWATEPELVRIRGTPCGLKLCLDEEGNPIVRCLPPEKAKGYI